MPGHSFPIYLCVAALAIGAAGCDEVRAAARLGSSADTSYIGIAVGLRTPERYKDVYPGVQMALDELNAKRPEGAPILALKRAPTSAKSAVDVAAAFRDDPSVIGVVGHTESDASIDAAPIYADQANGGKRALVAIAPTANGTMVTRLNDWVFRVCPVGTQVAKMLARFALDSLGMKRVAVVYRNDAMGKDFKRAFGEELVKGGGEVVETDPFVEEIPEFDAYGERIARRGIPAIAMAANPSDLLRARRATRANGATPVMLSTNPPPPIPDDADARDFDSWYYATIFSADKPPTSEGARYVMAFERRMGRKPDHWSALAYDAAMLIGRAAHSEGADRRGIRDRIARVGHGEAAYAGVTGRIAFDEHGDPIDKHVLVRTDR
jgi:branched-chain amino acid transport system substrate-binding protein